MLRAGLLTSFCCLVVDLCFCDQLFCNSPDFFNDDWIEGCKNSLLEQMKIEDRNSAAPVPQAFNKSTASSSFLKKSKLIGSCSTHSPGMETVQQELSCYLMSAELDIEGSPLSWWKQNEMLYPQLAQVACNVLAIPGE